MRQTQRVKKLLKEFMTYHNAGYPIAEIAKIFDVSEQTVYNYLEEIAIANGCTRKDLLQFDYDNRVNSPHFYHKATVDIDTLKNSLSELQTRLHTNITTITALLSTEE